MAKDLRSFVSENTNKVLHVPKPVSRDDLSDLIVQANQPVLFENIQDYAGWRIADLFFRDRAAQSAVLDTRPENVISELAEMLMRPPRKTRLVNNAPHKEKILLGNKIDLTTIPGFKHGKRDPLPALIVMNICRAPEGGPANLSFTRLSPFDRCHATMLIGSSPHQRLILEKWEALGEPMPMACVVGTHPAYEIMASYSVPEHLEHFGELDLVGNLINETVELVACETVPLEVPAHAELVIEGHVQPNERRADGPGPSQALYYLPGISQQPVFEVSSITMRNDPILRQHNTLMYSDHQPLITLPHECLMYTRLRGVGYDIKEVLYVPWGGTLACVVQMIPERDDQVRAALTIVLEEAWPSCRLAIAIDTDVDINSAEDLIWSITTRVDPARHMFQIPNSKGHPIDPTAWQKGDDSRDVLTNKWALDATKPSLKHPAERDRFERSEPPNKGRVSLREFL